MTTLKEYKAINDKYEDGVTMRQGQDLHRLSHKMMPDLIRVIELAEEALEDAEGYSFGNATQQEHEARRHALSEIRKLRG